MYKISDTQALTLVKLNENTNSNIYDFLPKLDVEDLEQTNYIRYENGSYYITPKGVVYAIAYVHGLNPETESIREDLALITEEQIYLVVDICRRGRKVEIDNSHDNLVKLGLLTIDKRLKYYEPTDVGIAFSSGYAKGVGKNF